MRKGLNIYIGTCMLGSQCNDFYTWEQLGITEEEFDAMSIDEQEKLVWEIASQNLDWGFFKSEEDGDEDDE